MKEGGPQGKSKVQLGACLQDAALLFGAVVGRHGDELDEAVAWVLPGCRLPHCLNCQSAMA
jgi:hypothetical protein